mgnify:CR=1 FL=1
MSDAPYGVSLPSYAGVLVALAEGPPLDAVLAQEGLTLDAWQAAENAARMSLEVRLSLWNAIEHEIALFPAEHIADAISVG